MTAAQEYLQQRQRRHPPRYPTTSGLDRVRQIYEMLKPGLPPELREMVANGSVAIGEVGRNIPDARVVRVGKGEYSIELTSGMMDFQYAVNRATAGLHRRHGEGDAPKSLAEVANLLEDILRQWARCVGWQRLWPWRRRITLPDFPINRDTHTWIERLATLGETSVLAHELGHVAVAAGLAPATSGNDEVDADRYGLERLILAVDSQGGGQRFAYAGPIIPIRILASLERLGARFSDRYPPQTRRVQLLREAVRERCPSNRYFYEVTTVMVAYQDMLDDLENRLDPKSPPALPDAERVLTRLLAELEEVAKDNVAISTFVEDLGFLTRAYPHGKIQEATCMLVGEYLDPPKVADAFLSQDLRERMAVRLRDLMAALPPDLRVLFPA